MNVNGSIESKLEDESFVNSLIGFDVISLSECWINDESNVKLSCGNMKSVDVNINLQTLVIFLYTIDVVIREKKLEKIYLISLSENETSKH